MIKDEMKGTLQTFPKISNKQEGKSDSVRQEQRGFHENSLKVRGVTGKIQRQL